MRYVLYYNIEKSGFNAVSAYLLFKNLNYSCVQALTYFLFPFQGISEGKEMPPICNGMNKFKYSQPILMQV